MWLQQKHKTLNKVDSEAKEDAVAIKAGNVQGYPAHGSKII